MKLAYCIGSLAWAAVGTLASLATLATHAQTPDGLRSSVLASPSGQHEPLMRPHWQARFGAANLQPAADASARLQAGALHLLGDYYWQGMRPARFGLSGGFRATGGLLVGERSLAWMSASNSARGGPAATGGRALRLGEMERELALAVPYLGVGYSGVSLRGGWGFTADLGIAGTGDGQQLRRDVPAHPRGAEEILREMRLTPVLQIGASYAF